MHYDSIEALLKTCSQDVRDLYEQQRDRELLRQFNDRPAPHRQQLGTKKNKYGNIRTEVDGITFDSRKEANRWIELRQLERAGQILYLQRQVRFDLYAGIYMRIDFTYMEQGQRIAEDVKGMRPTRDWLNKAKMFREIFSDYSLITS